jgi:hypothetical protein
VVQAAKTTFAVRWRICGDDLFVNAYDAPRPAGAGFSHRYR